ncbi:MAG: type II restriction endonuclease [Clostridia bacterium]|nr:type II restriction endonuclease [Clostridia bacterium]
MARNFEEWLEQFDDSIASWKYYTDFDKVYDNVNKIKNELNLLNGLIGSKRIEEEFKELINEYPKVLQVIPILIAKRENIIIIKDAEQDYYYNFKNMNYSIDDYVLFMRKTGIFDLLENHLIGNVFDYVTGVEVGMDTNGRKGRTGDAMEDLVESYLLKAGFVRDFNYFKEYTKTDIMNKWGIDLSHIDQKLKGESSNKNAEKRFDFVVKTDKMLYVIETNFYGTQGSKLNETARSYKMIESEFKNMKDVTFVWFTDGKGWRSARHNLEETFNEMENIYNISDMKNDIMSKIFK